MDEKLSINGSKGVSDLSGDKSMYDSIIQVPDKDLSPPSYTMPGVLHFLQSEWAKMESERGHWEIERAELQARIAFLQGERKGQENLKQDLVRRIKMLEYALKQERLKFQRWKHGEVGGARDAEENGRKSDEEAEESEYDPAAILAKTTQQVAASNAKWKESRTKLRQYLQEVGFTDTVVDARQARLREIMGGVSSHLQYSRAGSGVVNGGPLSHGSGARAVSLASRCAGVAALEERMREDAVRGLSGSTNNSSENIGVDGVDEEAETRSVLENFNFLSGATDEDDDEEMSSVRTSEEDGKGQDADEEVESALEEFDILVPHGGSPGPSVDLERPCINNLGEGEDEDEEEIQWTSPETLMRKLKAGRGAGKRATLRSMLASLNAGEEDEDDQDDGAPLPDNINEGVPHVTISSNAGTDTVDTVVRKKSSLSSQPQDWQHLVGLGDLATLTVANEAEDEIRCREAHSDRPVSSSMSSPNSIKSTIRRTWSVRYALRSHFDAVRAVAFHPTEPCLISASEDGTLKLWSIRMPPPGPPVGSKKGVGGPGCDVEPCYTFRGHDSPVLCVRFAAAGRRAYSSDLAGNIREWLIPDRLTVASDPDTGSNAAGVEEGVDLYEPFEMRAVHGRGWKATSAVWNITVLGDRLISCAADGVIVVWNLLRNDEVEDDTPQSVDEMTLSIDGDIRPTSMVCLPQESEDDGSLPRLLVGLTNGIVQHIDLGTKEILLTLEATAEDEDGKDTIVTCAVHCIAVHPLTTTVVAVGYEDRRIRFFDLSDGKCLHSMVAHLDAVTCLDVDPSGLYLLSGSHDCSLRIWNFETKACIQEITSHRKKFDESIHAVAFHPSKALMASGGADATARVFVS